MPTSEDLLALILSTLEEINAKLGASGENRDSVEITTSTRGFDVKVKSYAPTATEAGGAARGEWLLTTDELTQQLMGKKP